MFCGEICHFSGGATLPGFVPTLLSVPMRLASLLVSTVCVPGILAGCAQFGSDTSSRLLLTELEDVSTGSIQTRPAVVVDKDRISILHATRQGRVALQQGVERKLLDDTARVKQGGSYFQLRQPNEGQMQALWWSHQNGKNGYFTVSNDGGRSFSPVAMVNSDHQILQPITIAQSNANEIGVAYHDERMPNYQVYFNRSNDGGRTWASQDQRLDFAPANGRSSFVSEPQMVQTDNAWVVAWVDTVAAPDGAFRVVSRRSTDTGQTWSEPRTIFSANRHISALTVRAKGSQVVVIADALEDGMVALVSNDQGVGWSGPVALQGTEKASNSGVETAFNEKHLHIVWMQSAKEEKTRILTATLDLEKGKWIGAAQRLDSKPVDNTRSQTPTITTTLGGVALAAWVDFRDIRSNIYLSASYDQGSTWSPPQPLRQPGLLALGWPQLHRSGNQAVIAYETYPTDRVLEGRFVVQVVPLGDQRTALSALAPTEELSGAQRRERLERRIQALWDARIKGDYAAGYDYFDFAYKSVTPKKHYVDNTGVITYHTASIDTIAIKGNEAVVNMKLRYEMKPVTIPGTPKPISVPPVDVESPNTWVWVGNDWYLVYHPSYDPPVLKY